MLVSRIDRRFGAPIVRMVSPPRRAIFIGFSANLIRQILDQQYNYGLENHSIGRRTGQSKWRKSLASAADNGIDRDACGARVEWSKFESVLGVG